MNIWYSCTKYYIYINKYSGLLRRVFIENLFVIDLLTIFENLCRILQTQGLRSICPWSPWLFLENLYRFLFENVWRILGGGYMCHMRRRIHMSYTFLRSASSIRGHMCHLRRRIHVSYEEEDTYVIYLPPKNVWRTLRLSMWHALT